MSSLRPRTLLSVCLAIAAGAGLRLWFVHAFSQVQGDSLVYADIARNWLLHGIYGRTSAMGSAPVPTLVRLPGYPALLAACFAVFGQQNYSAVLALQVVVDLFSCLLIAAFVRRVCGDRAALVALWLAALCPFTANYVAMPLTETPSIFCVALGLYAFAGLMARPHWSWVLALAFAWSYAALLRPDGALLGAAFCPAIVLHGRAAWGLRRSLRVAFVCGLLSLLPFVPWTVRNWRTFHVFQPLAPRSATDAGEPTEYGFQRWTKTWLVDFASTYEIYWNVPGAAIDPHLLPARALDAPGDSPRDTEISAESSQLIAQYNADNRLTPQIDAAFGQLAARRIRARPFRYYVTLPLLRLADMWLRPRVEMLDIELRWWQYHLHHAETSIAYAYGALNLAYLLAALAGLFYWPRFATVMVFYIVLRSILLMTLEAPEPRYTLECFPIVIALAAAALVRSESRHSTVPTQAKNA